MKTQPSFGALVDYIPQQWVENVTVFEVFFNILQRAHASPSPSVPQISPKAERDQGKGRHLRRGWMDGIYTLLFWWPLWLLSESSNASHSLTLHWEQLGFQHLARGNTDNTWAWGTSLRTQPTSRARPVPRWPDPMRSGAPQRLFTGALPVDRKVYSLNNIWLTGQTEPSLAPGSGWGPGGGGEHRVLMKTRHATRTWI